MSKRGTEFVEEWISNNIVATGYEQEGDDAEARALAEQCVEQARQVGISKREIEEDIGDLVAYMGGAIVAANDAEVNRIVAKDKR